MKNFRHWLYWFVAVGALGVAAANAQSIGGGDYYGVVTGPPVGPACVGNGVVDISAGNHTATSAEAACATAVVFINPSASASLTVTVPLGLPVGSVLAIYSYSATNTVKFFATSPEYIQSNTGAGQNYPTGTGGAGNYVMIKKMTSTIWSVIGTFGSAGPSS